MGCQACARPPRLRQALSGRQAPGNSVWGLHMPPVHAQDPKKRATANEILQHSWMRENGTASDRPLDNVIVKRMQGFLHMNKLKKEALKVMATGMSPEEIAGLRSLFQVWLPLETAGLPAHEAAEGTILLKPMVLSMSLKD